MKFIIKVAAVAAAATLAPPAVAGVGVEANGARADDRWGGELGVGYSVGAAGFAVTPIVGAFLHRGDNDRYERDTFNNGQSRCRDLDTGQFADDSKCINIAVKAYGKIEATYSIPLGPMIGGGVRFSKDDTVPYGTVAFDIGPRFKLKGNVGDGYYAIGIRAGF